MLEEQFITMGRRIRLRRKELGLTQNRLAELLGISNNHLSAIENGREKPSLEKFVILCEMLKTTPDFLLLGNLHSCNVSQNISDNLRLCNAEDIKLAEQIVELSVSRNQNVWNKDINSSDSNNTPFTPFAITACYFADSLYNSK